MPISLAEQGICDDIAPVLAPDGDHLTLGEWLPATGRISIKCQEPGTGYHLQFKDLVPYGVYTVWHFSATGGGALASHPPNDIRNVFIADGEGSANHVALGTAGAMTFFGEIGDCALPINPATFDDCAAGPVDEFEVFLDLVGNSVVRVFGRLIGKRHQPTDGRA